jgi:hypothetical protein
MLLTLRDSVASERKSRAMKRRRYLLMGMIIVTRNAAGIVTGEWNGISAHGKRFLAVGMTMVLTALGILALAQHYS